LYPTVPFREFTLYGARPPENDEVWSEARKRKFEVKTFDKTGGKVTGHEKEVDTALCTDVGDKVSELKAKLDAGDAACDGTVIAIFSGDRDMRPAADKALAKGFRVVLFAFDSVVANQYKQLHHANPQFELVLLEKYLQRIAYSNSASTRCADVNDAAGLVLDLTHIVSHERFEHLLANATIDGLSRMVAMNGRSIFKQSLADLRKRNDRTGVVYLILIQEALERMLQNLPVFFIRPNWQDGTPFKVSRNELSITIEVEAKPPPGARWTAEERNLAQRELLDETIKTLRRWWGENAVLSYRAWIDAARMAAVAAASAGWEFRSNGFAVLENNEEEGEAVCEPCEVDDGAPSGASPEAAAAEAAAAEAEAAEAEDAEGTSAEADFSGFQSVQRRNRQAEHSRALRRRQECPRGLRCRQQSQCSYAHPDSVRRLWALHPRVNFFLWKTGPCDPARHNGAIKDCPFYHSPSDAWCLACKMYGHPTNDCRFNHKV